MRKLIGYEYVKLLKTCSNSRVKIQSDKSIPANLKHAMIAELYAGVLIGTNYQQMYVDLWVDALVKEIRSKCK